MVKKTWVFILAGFAFCKIIVTKLANFWQGYLAAGKALGDIVILFKLS
jgi:hypothetical protein